MSADHVLRSSVLSSPSTRHRSASVDIAYFPLVPNLPASSDSYECTTFSCPSAHVSPARVSLAWAILRLRHPILASIGLMDAFGKVSYSYDPPSNINAAIFDAEASVEYRRNTTPSDLLNSYKSGTRRVSRSHLSHLLFSSSPSGGFMISPPPSPPPTPPMLPQDIVASTTHEHTILICTPHYVADSVTLKSYIDELIILLTHYAPHSGTDLQSLLESEWIVSASKQPPTVTLKQVSPIALKMKLPREGRFLRTVTAS